MRNTKDPAAKVPSRSLQLQVPEEREEDLLGDLLAIMQGETNGQHITEKGTAKFLEEADDFAFDLGCRR